jgi:hypothetical protein
MFLDAANPRSYPGSGTSWTDLTGTNNNASLLNSPTYSSANNGYLIFNGSTQSGSISSMTNFPMGSSDRTLSAWVNFTTVPSYAYFIAYGTSANQQGCLLGVISGTWGFTGFGVSYDVKSSVTPVSGGWYHICSTYTAGTATIYLNAAQIQQSSVTLNTVSSWAYVAQRQGADYFPGYLSSAQIYNVALTAAQVQQNFNALRGRYGI